MTIVDELFYHTKKYRKELTAISDPLFKLFGVSDLGIFYVTGDGGIINIHTNVQWIEHCMEMKYYLEDQHIVAPDKMGSGFAICSNVPSENHQNGILADCSNLFNMWHGVTYVKRIGDGGYVALALDTKKNNPEMPRKILGNQGCLTTFTNYVEAWVHNLLKKESDRVVSLVELKGKKIETQIGFVEKDDEQNIANFFRELGVNHDGVNVNLTSREISCLDYSLKGYTAEETGEKLSIAKRTVERHIIKFREKMACGDKKDYLNKVSLLKSLGKL